MTLASGSRLGPYEILAPLNTLGEEEKADVITIVQNWMAGLKR